MLKKNGLKTLPFVLVFIVFFLEDQLGLSGVLPEQKWYMLAFFSAIFLLNESLIDLAFQNNREKFIPYYLAVVVVRMVLSMFFLVFFIVRIGQNAKPFAICFLALYLFFTMFEILDINRKLRRFSKEDKIVEKK